MRARRARRDVDLRDLPGRYRIGAWLGGARRPQQTRERERGEEQATARERAQRARRVALQLELPPQVVRVLDVPVREQHDVDRAEQDPGDAERPGGRERLREQRAAPVEEPPTRRAREA